MLFRSVVLDGDTVRIGAITVRLNGIDAEEMSEPHGRAAKSALQAAVGIGSPLSCTLDGSQTYGREVGVCRNLRGLDVAAEVIAAGWALDCKRFSRGRYRGLEPPGARAQLLQKPYCH